VRREALMGKIIYTNEFIEFCHKVFDKLPIAIDILDKHGRVIYINKCFSDFLQRPQEELIGRVVTDINPTSRFMEVLQSKQAEIAWKHSFHNGREAIVHRIPILNDSGEVTGGFGMVLFDDVDKMKEVMEKYNFLDKELKLYKNELAKLNSARYFTEDIVGSSQIMIKCKEKIKKIARVSSNVLVLGESGVGKELFAHSIHNESQRKDEPFVSINCSAIPENLLESELFGYEEGSFTGARKGGNVGKFQLANGGTIFLDEIGDMPIHMQVKLLRVLQEKEIERIGGKIPIKINVRVICATHKSLEELIKQNKFREDLYYRLNVLNLEVPPLRSRKEDIPLMVDKFLNAFYMESGLYRCIPEEVLHVLMNYDWPGNVRELRNVVERICVNSEDVNVSINDLPSNIVNSTIKSKHRPKASGLKEIMDSIEKDIIMNTLRECSLNKSEAAKKLNIPRATLYRKIEEYGLDVKM
jgi:transcriptional regulator with PAS, ATPase and Fis domain